MYNFERQLLICWGTWARLGGAGIGIARVDLLQKGSDSLIYGDDWMLAVDATIAGLPKVHKKVIKKTFLSNRGHLIPHERKEAAIVAFSHAFDKS